MNNTIWEYVQGCTICEQRRMQTPTRFQLYRMVPPTLLFVMIGMDTLKMPKSFVFEELVTMIDYTSDFGDAYAVRESTKVSDVVKALRAWICQFGRPQFVILDNAKYFVKGEFPTFAAKERIQLIPPAIYN